MGHAPPYGRPLAGRLEQVTFTSSALLGNPLGDPSERPLWVYVPPAYDSSPDARFPVIYLLAGWTGTVLQYGNREPFRASPVEAFDEVFATGGASPCLLVFVDGWTRYGGSQYVDSPATGAYQSYFCDEVVPWVDSHYRTLRDCAHRGVAGHSTGGFAATVSAMLRPDLFSAFASQAGDGLYEYCYLPMFARVVKMLRDGFDSSYSKFLSEVLSRPLRDDEGDALMVYGVAACFSAEVSGAVSLPFDLATGRLVDDVWQRWLAWDPVRMVRRHADALRSQRAIWIAAGRDDEYNLDIASMALAAELRAIGVPELHFELHDGRHEGGEWPYPRPIAYLAGQLSG